MTIRKSVVVARSPEDAFRIFTDRIGAWWPLKQGFSFDRQRASEIFLEGRIGGRLFERFSDNEEFEIGRVTTCDPPQRIVFTWKSPDWEAATEVEVRFIPVGGSTRVELEHRGWEAGPKMREAAKRFEGWTVVLEYYAAAA